MLVYAGSWNKHLLCVGHTPPHLLHVTQAVASASSLPSSVSVCVATTSHQHRVASQYVDYGASTIVPPPLGAYACP
eukprot:5024468-Pleurochrysis_carterae.AAC.1